MKRYWMSLGLMLLTLGLLVGLGVMYGCDAPAYRAAEAETEAPAAQEVVGGYPHALPPPATDGKTSYDSLMTFPSDWPQLTQRRLANAPDARSLALLPPTEDELWIIAKPDDDQPAAAPDRREPNAGRLLAQIPDAEEEGEKLVPMPLKHTAVAADITAFIASVGVKQQYHNPYDTKIEAVYVFPLPQNAAVNEFVMTIGERRIRGIIREREEAEKIYTEARRQGHVASLLTQERPNIFTQKVANIEPGKAIDIDIRYFHTLAYDDGYYEFVFPMVVGPRYNPEGMTDGVGAVARGQHGTSGQKTEVQYLTPHERSGHDISLSVKLNAGVPIETIHSVNHHVFGANIERGATSAALQLAAEDTIPNKDFVLRWRVAGEQLKTNAIVQQTEDGGYFTLMLYPPKDLGSLERQPMEMIFVLDCSGSMNGRPIEQAKAAVARALETLRPGDSFQLIRFSNNASALGNKPLEATPENIRRGLRYLSQLKGSGGTQMIEGIKAALDFPHDPGRIRTVAFLTDGYIGNEMQILGEVHKRLDGARVFSFGVGSSPNRFLLDRMAVLGRGAVAYLSLNDDPVAVMDRFTERISHPALMDVGIDFGDLAVQSVFPRRIGDLVVGRPILLTGRFHGALPEGAAVRVSGKANGEAMTFDVPLTVEQRPMAEGQAPSAIAAVWARMQIAELTNMMAYLDDRDGELQGTIRQLALDHSLMSAYTAFVAVDSATRTAGTQGVTVPVAVPVPDGVRYETTVME